MLPLWRSVRICRGLVALQAPHIHVSPPQNGRTLGVVTLTGPPLRPETRQRLAVTIRVQSGPIRVGIGRKVRWVSFSASC